MEKPVFSSLQDLVKSLEPNYSVTAETMEKYRQIVKQYPLYEMWFAILTNDILNYAGSVKEKVRILEYGPGFGILAGIVKTLPNLELYVGIEPDEKFREATLKMIGDKGRVFGMTAETFKDHGFFDIVTMTAASHHFHDKPKAFENAYNNLKPGGILTMGDVFLPEYDWDENYHPKDKVEFADAVLDYAAEQIYAMFEPNPENYKDQISTAVMDLAREGEYKVCASIIADIMLKTGFDNVKVELLKHNLPDIDYNKLGYYYVFGRKSDKLLEAL